MSYQIKYNRSRFPIQPKREDGTWGCRGCGGDIPKGRHTWCSKKCCHQFHPQFVISAAKRRDKEICSECGLDCRQALSEWMANKPRDYDADYLKWRNQKPTPIEYDHIVPFSEGGQTVLGNIRSLCANCHKKRTRKWHGERKNKREGVLPLFQATV